MPIDWFRLQFSMFREEAAKLSSPWKTNSAVRNTLKKNGKGNTTLVLYIPLFWTAIYGPIDKNFASSSRNIENCNLNQSIGIKNLFSSELKKSIEKNRLD
jgi:hypothetical protein